MTTTSGKGNRRFIRPQRMFQADARLDDPGGKFLVRSPREISSSVCQPVSGLPRTIMFGRGNRNCMRERHAFRHNRGAYIWPEGFVVVQANREGEDPALEENMPSRSGTTLGNAKRFEPLLTQHHSPSLTSPAHHPNPLNIGAHGGSYPILGYLAVALLGCFRKPSTRTFHLGLPARH